jgi:phosphoribosylaminoimidazolecarboxamide formyltransferase/IMP cyclohydrolase
MGAVRRALISVYDKSGLISFARGLHTMGIEIVSTGGTAGVLGDAGIPYRLVEQLTGFPEFLNGRVKTLHPVIHGGILARRDRPEHMAALERLRIDQIDLVAVSLYPFERVAERPGSTRDEILEMIDIGGVALLRAAAKNFPDIVVISSSDQYDLALDALKQNDGDPPLEFRRGLARDAFTRLSAYDAAISAWLDQGSIHQELPLHKGLGLWKVMDLRYGENPHQKAALYMENEGLELPWKQLQGVELSFNNLQDLDAARRLAGEFSEPTCAILKHTTPCGVGCGETLLEAFQRARATDPQSAFGGVVAVNRPLTVEFANALSDIFLEVVAAPSFETGTLEILSKKKKLRLLETHIPPDPEEAAGPDIRRIRGGLLVQDWDEGFPELDDVKVVTKRKPTDDEMAGLVFGWKVVKHVKSNAVIYCNRHATLGIGAGQMSRVDSARFAALKAEDAKLDLAGSVAASDAFFPFRDGVDTIAAAGATAVIHPGGSIRDQQVIDAADEHDMAMVLTGRRHFRH